MGGCGDDDVRVVADHFALVLAVLRFPLARRAAHQGEVELEALEAGDDVLAIAELDAQRDMRVGAVEGGECAGAKYLAVLTTPTVTRPRSMPRRARTASRQPSSSASIRAVAAITSSPASVGHV